MGLRKEIQNSIAGPKREEFRSHVPVLTTRKKSEKHKTPPLRCIRELRIQAKSLPNDWREADAGNES